MGAVVAAIIARKERDVVDMMRYVGAISPAAARPIQDLGIDDDVGFRRLRDREVVRESAPGRYYLDEGVWASVRRTRRRATIVIAAIALIITVGVATGLLSLT